MMGIKDKYLLSIKEASEYFGIGQHKLRRMAGEFNCPFALHIGKHTKIKKKELEEYLSKTSIL